MEAGGGAPAEQDRKILGQKNWGGHGGIEN
jgi:hypothetical protein